MFIIVHRKLISWGNSDRLKRDTVRDTFPNPHSSTMSSNIFGKITSDLIKCVNFAAIKHKDGRRCDKAQTPYINHPLGVAFILTEEAGVTDLNVIKAAILHDTVEDTETTFEELAEHFGQYVKNIVAEVTDDKSLPKMKRKTLQIENAPKLTFEARLVRLADKLYNLRDLSREIPVEWSETRREEYFKWAKQVVDPIRGTNAAIEKELDEIFAKHCPS